MASSFSTKLLRSADGGDGDASVTRCVCGRNEDTEGFMVQCETCQVWQHGRCVGVRPRAVPDQYFCEKCKKKRKRVLVKDGKTKPTKKNLKVSGKASAKAEPSSTRRPVKQREGNLQPLVTLSLPDLPPKRKPRAEDEFLSHQDQTLKRMWDDFDKLEDRHSHAASVAYSRQHQLVPARGAGAHTHQHTNGILNHKPNAVAGKKRIVARKKRIGVTGAECVLADPLTLARSSFSRKLWLMAGASDHSKSPGDGTSHHGETKHVQATATNSSAAASTLAPGSDVPGVLPGASSASPGPGPSSSSSSSGKTPPIFQPPLRRSPLNGIHGFRAYVNSCTSIPFKKRVVLSAIRNRTLHS